MPTAKKRFSTLLKGEFKHDRRLPRTGRQLSVLLFRFYYSLSLHLSFDKYTNMVKNNCQLKYCLCYYLKQEKMENIPAWDRTGDM